MKRSELFKRENLIEMLYEECKESAKGSPDYGYKVVVATIFDLILFRLKFLIFLVSAFLGSAIATLMLLLRR